MADIFLSYAHEDQNLARMLAELLTSVGWSVFWDREILAGTVFDDAIQEQLDHAKCVVALWSVHSVASQWVRAEAEEGANRNMLVSVLIDDVRLPIAFRRIQAAKLLNWSGSKDDEQLKDVLRAIKFEVEKPPKESALAHDVAGATMPSPPRPVSAGSGFAYGAAPAAAPASRALAAPTPRARSPFLVAGIVVALVLAGAGAWLARRPTPSRNSHVPSPSPTRTLSEADLSARTKRYAELLGANKPDEVRADFTSDFVRASASLTGWSRGVEKRGALVQVGNPKALKVIDSERRSVEVPITFTNEKYVFTFTYTPDGQIANLVRESK